MNRAGNDNLKEKVWNLTSAWLTDKKVHSSPCWRKLNKTHFQQCFICSSVCFLNMLQTNHRITEIESNFLSLFSLNTSIWRFYSLNRYQNISTVNVLQVSNFLRPFLVADY